MFNVNLVEGIKIIEGLAIGEKKKNTDSPVIDGEGYHGKRSV